MFNLKVSLFFFVFFIWLCNLDLKFDNSILFDLGRGKSICIFLFLNWVLFKGDCFIFLIFNFFFVMFCICVVRSVCMLFNILLLLVKL